MTTLENDDIDISMGHVLLFPKIYNLALCHTIKANRQTLIPCYPTIAIFYASTATTVVLLDLCMLYMTIVVITRKTNNHNVLNNNTYNSKEGKYVKSL